MNDESLTAEEHNRIQVERWLVSRGVPHLIDDYSARSDIWTRARPFLLVVLVLQTALAFNDRFTGLAQGAMFLLTGTLLLASAAVFNRWRGRHHFAVPQDVGIPELAFFVVAPALLVLLVGQDPLLDAVITMVSNLLLLALVYVIVGFGLLPMLWWATKKIGDHLRALSRLVARTLPVLLVLTVFMFINAEIWQVAYAVEPPLFGVVSTLLIGIGLAFIWFSTDQILHDVQEIESVDEARLLAGATPLDLTHADLAPLDLTRGGRLNLRILLMTSLAVQVVLVGMLVTAFYILLGLLLVNPAVLAQWTQSPDLHELLTIETDAVGTLAVTREHLRVAGLVGSLAGLNIAVSGLTDESYRHAFTADIVDEIRENLAVRRLYRASAND